MTGAFIILVFTILVGVVLYALELRHRRRDGVSASGAENEPAAGPEPPAPETPAPPAPHGPLCCGQHLVCEKDTLSPLSGDIVYYDDEELDRFIGRDGRDYTPGEIDEFQEVLITLRPEDVVGWARSITVRRIVLPPVVRDELLMMVNEQRKN